ncbi:MULTISPECIES: DUF1028 domain-containing protein [unclassified Nocardioides]|uniref:DUF1028 domain-containing protein n=1 Tax=unclassified Nocardioides TaxID=2615069 RepID=UPI0009F04C29|nr:MULTISPECIES: DUF1028 domain-containing protein [unclassified Nocardioides]GAW49154.1 Hypothetical conserved protein [Nocardioides sp. PD653-B2]GAW55642.1 Hypothetical conserved protein [Nocardioides sp. PD653]
MTYSVAVVDLERQEMALGSVSHSCAAFTKVFASAAVSHRTALVASQAFSSKALGQACADLASTGEPGTTLEAACRAESWAPYRQLLAVTNEGMLFAHTGAACVRWAGHAVDEATSVVAAGNMLEGPEVLAAVMRAAGSTAQSADERVLAGLAAGGAAGGDFRGDRSAGLCVVGASGSYDVRVDDHDQPHEELLRLSSLERGRSALARCYAWIAEGRPAVEVDPVLDSLAQGAADDPELAAWQLAVRLLSGRAGDQGAHEGTVESKDGEVAAFARLLVERLAPEGVAQ